MEAERRAQLQASTDAKIDKVRQLMQLKGMGINGAWLVVMEFSAGARSRIVGKWGAERASRRRRIKAASVPENKA